MTDRRIMVQQKNENLLYSKLAGTNAVVNPLEP